MSGTRRRRVGLALVAGALAVLPCAATARAQSTVAPPPQVVHTGTGPTGYEVTFKLHDPTATRMRIKGEWFFASPATQPAVHLPSEWRPGDFPLTSPNGANENWPVADMTFDAATGMWSYTTPLPAGTFMYWLYRDCNAAAPQMTGCTPQSDPANPPWSPKLPVSTVYVPLDPAFGTEDYAWTRPAANKGTLRTVVYPSPQSTNPVGSHELAVYTPPGYDPDRSVPYPLMIISHGGNGNEADWFGRAVANNILDNLIADGKMQPAVVAATNFNGIPNGNVGYAADVVTNVIPYLDAHYNVSTDPQDMAFAGLSLGGQRANHLLFNHTTAFGYFGTFSTAFGVPAAGNPLYANPALKTRLGILVGSGVQDTLFPSTRDLQQRLTAAGVQFLNNNQNGGHTWWIWRIMLRDFVASVAFRATSTSVTAALGSNVVTAKVAAATRQPAVPTGTVQFYAGSTPLGEPVALTNGEARIPLTTTAGETAVHAVYSGNDLYNASTSRAVALSATSSSGSVGGAVPATLSLTLGAPAAFGSFTPGVANEYAASTTATVTTTAGDALLSVADASSTATGRLVNGAFSLTSALQASAGAPFADVGGAAAPNALRTWAGPTSNEAVAIAFRQRIAANEALRTGSYSKTLTFTLSTTSP